MGCDYYQYIYVKVVWEENGETRSENNLVEKRPVWTTIVCDSDSEDDYDRKLDQRLHEDELRYGTKLLYENGEWKITSRSSIDDYSELLPKNGTSVKMTKLMQCMERC